MTIQAPGGDGLSGPQRFTGAALEGTNGEGLSFVEGLAVVVDEVGVTTEGPEPGAQRTVGWHQMSSAHVGEPARFPDGSPAVTIVATAGAHRLRWFIPVVQLPPPAAAALDEILSRRVGAVPAAAGAGTSAEEARREPEPPPDDDPWAAWGGEHAAEPLAVAEAMEPDAVLPGEPPGEADPEPEAMAPEPPVDVEPSTPPAADGPAPEARAPHPLQLRPTGPFVIPDLPGSGGPSRPVTPPLVLRPPVGEFGTFIPEDQPPPSEGPAGIGVLTPPQRAAPDPAPELDEPDGSIDAPPGADTGAMAVAGANATGAPDESVDARQPVDESLFAPLEAEVPVRPEGPLSATAALTAPPLPRTQVGRRRRRSRRAVGMAAVAVGAVVATISALALTRTAPPVPVPPATPVPTTATADELTAAAVTLTSTDVPAGWTVAPHPSVSAASSALWQQALTSCLGLPASEDPLGHPPVVTAEHDSDAFAGTPAPTEVEIASESDVYPSSATVSAEISELSSPRFSICLEQAEVRTVSGVSVAGAVAAPLSLEQVPGVRSVGYQILFPGAGSAKATNVDFVVVAGGRVATRLVAVGVGQPFPPLVAAASSYNVAKRVAAQETSP